MKKLLYIITVLGFFSCEDIVDLDVPEGPRKLVVDGGVDNQLGPYTVKLSYTQDYNSTAESPKVSGATVVVFENDVPDTLTDQGGGVYVTQNLQQTTIGNSYKLYVRTEEGEEYESTAEEILVPVPLDSFRFAFLDTLLNFGNKEDEDRPGEKIYLPYYEYNDPEGVRNYYRFNYTINASADRIDGNDRFRLRDDRFNDGQFVEDEIRTNCFVGDTIDLDFISISKERRDYLQDFTGQLTGGGPFSPAISPVIGNVFKKGSTTDFAVGYFQAVSYLSYRTIVIE